MFTNRTRIAAPFVVAGLVAVGAAVPTLGASASPDLPAITPQHLVQKALHARVSHLSATVSWTANLGLPSLSGLTSGAGQSVSSSAGFDPTTLLSGTHSFNVWIDGPMMQRIAAPGTLSETDLVRRGNQAWLYDSSTDAVTHYVTRGRAEAAPTTATPLEGVSVTQLADHLLSAARSVGTTVSAGHSVEVAGHAAYVLRLAPDRSIAANRTSTVSSVTIAVDATTGLPLRVDVYAVGQHSPALQVGYSSLSYATPSVSLFAVPKGQTTTTKVLGHAGTSVEHSTWGRSAPAVRTRGPASRTHRSDGVSSDWGTIANLPSGQLTGAAAGELDSVSTVVLGGSARLVSSTLVNALVLNNGRVLVGLVTPAALEAAAAHLSH
jgi:outer membrane lipoprotein-sorting protein